VDIGLHPRALPCGEDDCGKVSGGLRAHGCSLMAPASATETLPFP
jgi:hypothetical protein